MKIYYITNARIPTEKANGYQIVMNCKAFALQGAEVELWVPTRENKLENLDPFSYYNIPQNFKIKWIKSLDFLRWLKWISKVGFVLQSWFFLFSLTFTKPDKDSIIYSRSPEIIRLFSKRGYKTVWESHGSYTNWNKNLKFLSKIRLIITLTENSRQRYIKVGVDPKKIIVAPDGVDLNLFDIDVDSKTARQKLNLPHDKKIIGYFGSLNTVNIAKGMNEIILALKMLPEDVLLISVGGNKEDIKKYLALAEKEGVSNKVLFKEQVNRETLALYQKATDILLMPFPWVEHFAYFMSPMKMFEYMAAKRPVVTTDLPATREILDEGTAMIIPPGDHQKLAEAIQFLFNHSEEANKLANNAYEKVKNYTWEKRAEKILNFMK